MKKTIFSIISFIMLTACSANRLPFGLGQKAPPETVIKDKILSPYANSFDDYGRITYKACEFSLGLSQDSIIKYISTTNPSFKVKNIGVGSKYSDIKTKGKIKTVKGWAYYVPIDKEWHAAFYPNPNDTLSEDSRVSELLQYFGKPRKRIKTESKFMKEEYIYHF